MTITRAVGAAALSVAFAAGAVAPAVASTMRSDQFSGLPPYSLASAATGGSSACATRASQLMSQITSIGTDLTAVPPKTADVTGPVGQVVDDVNALQSSGCLPKVPGAPVPTLPAACVPDVAKLLSDVFALAGDVSALPPNIGGALHSVGGLVADVTSLVTVKCLPAVTPPKVAGLPSLPLPTPGLPTPGLPVPSVPVPAPSLPVSPPSVPVTAPSLPLPAPSLPLPTPKLPVPAPSLPVAIPTPPVLPPAPKLPLPVPSVPSLPTLPSAPSLPTLPSAPSLPMLPSATGTP